ncbi:hypothetical protein [Cupriavidus sp. TMH.W2]|uniref:hypothetical protein n=1 Tax=Cupriavidus sp. TMH.W2 TaxID=3434465 RepID=UPI003D789D50
MSTHAPFALTRPQAESVWQILVNCCLASSAAEDQDAFIRGLTRENPVREWRFAGALGFGGKLRFPRLTVDCYPEDLTPERQAMIDRANVQLAGLGKSGDLPAASTGSTAGSNPVGNIETSFAAKPSLPEIKPLVRAWYAKPGNGAGGLFHLIIEGGNNEQRWANAALEAARASGDADAICLGELLAAMSPTQRQKLSKTWHLTD